MQKESCFAVAKELLLLCCAVLGVVEGTADVQTCTRAEGESRPRPHKPAALFVDLDGVLCDFDRGVHEVTGHLPDNQAGLLSIYSCCYLCARCFRAKE